MTGTAQAKNSHWTLLFLSWLIALVSTLGALFLGEVMGMAPCVLCWYQRIAMFPLVIILGVGLLPFDYRSVRYALPLAVTGSARLQNVYWPVLEAMLAAQPVWASHERPQPELIWDHIKETGIDIAKAKADVNDPRIATILKQDMADVATLKVTGTPSFFVNGKPLIDFGPDELKELVRKEVRVAYGK